MQVKIRSEFSVPHNHASTFRLFRLPKVAGYHDLVIPPCKYYTNNKY